MDYNTRITVAFICMAISMGILFVAWISNCIDLHRMSKEMDETRAWYSEQYISLLQTVMEMHEDFGNRLAEIHESDEDIRTDINWFIDEVKKMDDYISERLQTMENKLRKEMNTAMDAHSKGCCDRFVLLENELKNHISEDEGAVTFPVDFQEGTVGEAIHWFLSPEANSDADPHQKAV